jgi:adenosylmethionine-8-amino-7-oxononanoate aminotransferase
MFIHIFTYMGTHKTCKICGEIKSIDNFYESQRGSKCKDCTLQMTREYKKQKRKNLEFRK